MKSEAWISERAGADCGASGSPSQAPRAGRRRAAARTVISGLLALGAALLLDPNAQARLTFPPAQKLGLGGSQQVAVDSQDRATVVWSGMSGIQSVRLDADGNAETVQNLGQGASPQVAADSQGRATVVWRAFEESDFLQQIKALRLGADGSPGSVHTLSEAGAATPQVAVDPQGRATVVWERGGGSRTVQSVRLGADGTPDVVHTLSEAGARDPQVAVDPQGRATVVWERGGGRPTIQSVRLGADGAAGAVKTLSNQRNGAVDPQVALDPKGRATVVWLRRGKPTRVESVRLGADGTHRGVKSLSQGISPQVAVTPQVAVDSRGRATVVWAGSVGSGTHLGLRVHSVRLGTDGSQGAVRTLSKADGYYPQVAVDSRGRAAVVWQRSHRSAPVRIQARRLRRHGAPEAVQTLSQPGQDAFDPQVAVDSQGRPTVVWSNHGVESTRGRNTR